MAASRRHTTELQWKESVMLPSLSQMKQYFGIDAATCITSRLLFPYLNDFIIIHFHKQAKLLFVQK